MKLTMFLPWNPDRRWDLARQAGVEYAVCKLAPELTGRNPPWDIDVLAEAQKRFKDAEITLYGLEGDQFNMDRIKRGIKGREEDLDLYKKMLRNMGELGIPLLCYNFMVGIGWFRTQKKIVERGGALTSGFDLNDLQEDYPCIISAEEVWDHYKWFMNQVLPVAEEANVRMGLHPDDPPIPSLKGYSRIFYNAAGYDRAMSLSSSRAHGITFCQANFYAAGEDVPDLIRRWKDRIAFVHFRDIRGTALSFVESFHDNGDHDMSAAIRAYKEIGFDGPIRTDHAPSMAGEGEGSGYEILGHLFALGYLKGLWEQN